MRSTTTLLSALALITFCAGAVTTLNFPRGIPPVDTTITGFRGNPDTIPEGAWVPTASNATATSESELTADVVKRNKLVVYDNRRCTPDLGRVSGTDTNNLCTYMSGWGNSKLTIPPAYSATSCNCRVWNNYGVTLEICNCDPCAGIETQPYAWCTYLAYCPNTLGVGGYFLQTTPRTGHSLFNAGGPGDLTTSC
jgi:hypothetical protein